MAIYLNTGTNNAPEFGGTTYDTVLLTAPGGDAVPFLIDWDNNGKRDLLVGSGNGNVYLYLNQRLDASSLFSAAPTIVASVSANAAPVAVRDWDGDGAKDLVVGDGDGLLHLFLNENTDATPSFSVSTTIQTESAVDIDAGTNAVPVVLDFDGDNKKDLLIAKATAGSACT